MREVMIANITRFMQTCDSLAKGSIVGRPAPALQRGDGGVADWVILSINCLRHREPETYRSVVDKLKVIGAIREVLALDLVDLADPSTLCKAMNRLTTALCRRLLERTIARFDRGEVQVIDGLRFDRIAACRRYARRTDPGFWR